MDNTPVVQTTNTPIEPIPPPSSKNYLKFIIAGLIILFIGLFGGYYLTKSSSKPLEKACTMEAKICPDGSSVSRTGPNCEFIPCPEVTGIQLSPTSSIQELNAIQPIPSPISDPTANWKTYNAIQLSLVLKYPYDWFVEENNEGHYIRIQNYDPKTALGRGYDPLQDKGKYLLTVTLWEDKAGITSIGDLKNALPKNGDSGFYIGDPAGKIIIKNEKSYSINEFPAYYREKTYTDFPDVLEQEIYLLNDKGIVLSINYGLDFINGKPILDKILSTFKFL